MRITIESLIAAAALAFFTAGCNRTSDKPAEVVVYSSVDEVFARPVAERFSEDTDIAVRLVPDTEETKSTGLLNRLIAERERPQADVFWSGDPVRAAILKSKGVSEPYRSPNAAALPVLYSDAEGHWTGFSARARVLIYNKELVAEGEEPRSVLDLNDPRFQGKACIANPLFGTTSMHAAALFQVIGEEKARDFFQRFIENGGSIVSSNGEVRRRVAAGDFAVGITDTDDFNVAFQEGKPVAAVYPDQDGMGTLIVPNAAVLVRGGPNPDGGKQFIDYLLRPETEKALAESEAAQMPVRPGVAVPDYVQPLDELQPMQVHYGELADLLERLSAGFLREWVEASSR
ncbi:MAG: extracellular solute-binding protein [Bryobacteraceae bacterium]|nr:extracellular solute-binding protein [Bryobacteraceae bacterium]